MRRGGGLRIGKSSLWVDFVSVAASGIYSDI